MAHDPHINISSLPDVSRSSFDFLESSFFRGHRSTQHLPTPAAVRASAETGSNKVQPLPVKFENLDLLVKFGPHISVVEAQCLWMVRRTFGSLIPVPEVYAWRVDQQEVFIYMELVRGRTLKDRWDSLTAVDRAAICCELQQMLAALRSAKLQTHEPFIGSTSNGPVADITFEGMPERGPFPAVKTFHDWISWLLWRRVPEDQRTTDPWRSYLPDEQAIVLTHGDLHQENIIVSPTGPPRIIAIVDWAQASWYPVYWEYCKACYTASYTEEWRIE